LILLHKDQKFTS